MGRFEALVEVQLRPGISDPQGATIERALPALGFTGVSGVRAGKAFRLSVEALDDEQARHIVEDLSERLLANPVIEAASVSIIAAR
ncbi:MAG TPA: phosphoribosylformylglycinamidine synthase subunit PurS [Acidimicrobiales bacterium]|jgi:phosphoribosylformylglycinamidine synthase subunit PurS|nr:phosphoribosylformylglycinamidine synthase subunit PurS [Acidimicrobiales bacterium]